MIRADAKLSIQRIPLEHIQVKEYQERFPIQLNRYMHLLLAHPGEYAGFLCVQPSTTHKGMFELLDGHTRFCASIMTGRKDVLAVIIEESDSV